MLSFGDAAPFLGKIRASRMLAFRNARFSPSGTDGSNPLSSSGESTANFEPDSGRIIDPYALHPKLLASVGGAPPWRGANRHNMHKVLEDANRLKPETAV
jgi:hypothetical protein